MSIKESVVIALLESVTLVWPAVNVPVTMVSNPVMVLESHFVSSKEPAGDDIAVLHL